MSVKETISHVVDTWFLYEPLLFNVYCTHKLEENDKMKCAYDGKRCHNQRALLPRHEPEECRPLQSGIRAELRGVLQAAVSHLSEF